ncbi:MAG: hypothetical protein JWR36_1315 [Glaciihabitans sp.]|nr:hypothetical protein [Glaciihabitans sp.]MDQ1570448.1 hypothetical protein [Actinomycetota bacterium]
MTTPTVSPVSSLRILALHRGQLVAVAIIGAVLGIIGLLLPGVSYLTIAIIFGIYLVASGIFRINSALLAPDLGTGTRWLIGLLGVLVVVAGVICLANPFQSLVVLAYVIGLGWIAEGITDIMSGIQGGVRPRWYYWVSGVVSIIAGIISFVLPAVAIATFVLIGSILLLFVSISTLLTLPRKEKVAR